MATINLSSYFTSTSGNGTTDDTAIFQKALNAAAGGTLYIPKASAAYTIGTVTVPSNVTIVFEEGTVVNAKSGLASSYCLFNFNGASNVTIIGNNSTVNMKKSEYSGENPHCFSMVNCSNVSISGMTAYGAGGDGFYINTASNIHLDGVVADNCRRVGCNVINANGVLVENSIFKNTSGVAPQYGINVEANKSTDIFKNIVFQNCLCANNAKTGVGVSLTNLQNATSRVDVGITFTNITTLNNGKNGMELYAYNTNNGIGGSITVNNYTSNGDALEAMVIANNGTLSPHIYVNKWNYLNPSSYTKSGTYPAEIRDSSAVSSGYIQFTQGTFTATVPTGTTSTTTTTTSGSTTTTSGSTTTTSGSTTTTTTTATTIPSATISGTSSNNTLTGTTGNDVIYGLAGNDTISGGNGNDNLWGGAGADRLTGGTGQDTYVFGKSEGSDVITSSSSNYEDKILFNTGVKLSDLTVKLLSNSSGYKDLVISCGSTDSITVQNWNYSSGTQLNTVQFASDSSKYKLTMTNGVASWSKIS